MSPLDEALTKAAPEVNFSHFRRACFHLRHAKTFTDGVLKELTARSYHARTYGLPDEDSAIIKRIEPILLSIADNQRELGAICREVTEDGDAGYLDD